MLNVISVILFAYLAVRLFRHRNDFRENKYLCGIAGYLAVFESVTLVHPEPMGSALLFAAGILLKGILALCCFYQLHRKKPARKVVPIASYENKSQPRKAAVSSYRRAV